MACHSPAKNSPSPEHCFYYWKSVYAPGAAEKTALQQLQVKKLYVKFFDVTWQTEDHVARPVARLSVKDTSLRAITVVPVVFITNETLLNVDSTTAARLAERIGKLVFDLVQVGKLTEPRELQLDCDWTLSTKDNYFTLLRSLRSWLDNGYHRDCRLSATIRLHQCRYRDKTGVPPVDRGLLMCYNMGNLKDPAAGNSIFDAAELEKYTRSLSAYPLPLDIALPLFDWKVLFRRDQFAGLVTGLPASQLVDNPAVEASGDRYTFLRDTSLGNYSFEAGDKLRDEQSDYHSVSAAAVQLRRRMKTPPSAVILFHLDSSTLSKYSIHEMETIFDSVH